VRHRLRVAPGVRELEELGVGVGVLELAERALNDDRVQQHLEHLLHLEGLDVDAV
jgi:hypothetical protein